MDIFSHIFKMVTPKALRHLLLFIALNYLTSAAFIANLCSHLIPVHYKTSTTCTSNVHFKVFFADVSIQISEVSSAFSATDLKHVLLICFHIFSSMFPILNNIWKFKMES